jgi:hypothetical protein
MGPASRPPIDTLERIRPFAFGLAIGKRMSGGWLKG